LAVAWFGLACHHDPPPVAPAEPLPAEPEITLTSMDDECNGLMTALERYRECVNHDDDDREGLRNTIEFAEQSFAAGKKATLDAPAQRVIALACHRAEASVRAANERCLAGPKPRVD
jgi:hypothetical protein